MSESKGKIIVAILAVLLLLFGGGVTLYPFPWITCGGTPPFTTRDTIPMSTSLPTPRCREKDT